VAQAELAAAVHKSQAAKIPHAGECSASSGTGKALARKSGYPSWKRADGASQSGAELTIHS